MEGYGDGHSAGFGDYCLNAKDNMGQPRALVVAEAREAAVGPGWDPVRKSISELSAEW